MDDSETLVTGAGVVAEGVDCADTACPDDEDADEAVTLGGGADACVGAD